MRYFMPLNIFQVRGIYCCLAMHDNFNKQEFIKNIFCYSARDITHANMLVIWGYVSPKLAGLLQSYYAYLSHKKYIIQVNTCEGLSGAHQILGTNKNILCSDLNIINIKKIIKEARLCLRA
jgi:NADH:ubiquinone oxidoreductase subunit B-like Fe-S oxidoreductase